MEWGHKFSQETKDMFANFVSKKDHGDCFLGQGGCGSGGFPRTWFNNKLWEMLWNIGKVKKSNSNQVSVKTEFQGFVFSWQLPPAHGQLHLRALWSFWMGGVWSSAVQSRSCTEQLPLVSKHEDMACNAALRWRRGTAGRREWVVSGSKILWRWN